MGSCLQSPLLGKQTGKTVIQGQSNQKVSKVPSQPISQMWWCVPVFPAKREAEARRIMSEASPGQKHDTLSEK
jgi:hypothetical protein